MHKIKIEKFEGPLDLLLQLIDERKLEITEVSLVEVTEQYLRSLQAAQREIGPAELADYLVIAARLLLLKSRALLPFLEWEDDEQEDLTSQLKIYRQYLEASRQLQQLLSKRRFSFSRERLLTVEELGFQPPEGLGVSQLVQAFRSLLARLEPPASFRSDTIQRTISLQEKIQQLRERVWSQTSSSFHDYLRLAKDRTEVIVSFIALLELIKQQQVLVRQVKHFEDIIIERAGT